MSVRDSRIRTASLTPSPTARASVRSASRSPPPANSSRADGTRANGLEGERRAAVADRESLSGEPPERFLIGLAVLSLLSAVASERPLLCIIEDAQWLDGASAQVLGFVSRRIHAEGVAIVLAIREPHPRPEFDGLPELWLDGLPADDARALLASAVTGRVDKFALNAKNGEIIWTYEADINPNAERWRNRGVALGEDKVFAVQTDGRVIALDDKTGKRLWESLLGEDLAPGVLRYLSAAPLYHEGVIYTGGSGSGGTVYAVNANTGALLWTSSVMNGGNSSPAVTNDGVYVSYSCPNVYKLDPATGAERWRYDAGVDPHRGYGDFASRGVSFWRDTRAAAGTQCARRIFAATIDARLVALDAAAGKPCLGFGTAGAVDLRQGLRVPPTEFQFYEVTSPPVVVGDLVITGSAVADNTNLAPASGEVRAFDARTGALRWTFDPVPQDSTDPAFRTWQGGSAVRTGAANVWSVMVADPDRDLVFLPTSSPAPDYFGGLRLGENRYANSIVALRASTGRVVWHFQTVHHDLWDYDNAAPPALATVTQNGVRIPAVIQATKSGMMFVLDRLTGRPLFPVEERAVPASSVREEVAAPTQPFTAVTPPLVPLRYSADDAWGPTPEAKAACRAILSGLRNDGPFTPPTLQGTLVVPSNIGGAHWSGVAIDEGKAIAVVPVNRVAAMVQLFPADDFNRDSVRGDDAQRGIRDFEYTRMRGTPYIMRRRIILGPPPSGLPCTPPPFGALVAVNLATGGILWNVPLGAMGGVAGSPNLGGPIATASGLVFIGATLDRQLHAFDIATGRELWSAPLPAGARATPMTYEAGGRQFVVIAAGGGGPFGAGDAIIAFALPR